MPNKIQEELRRRIALDNPEAALFNRLTMRQLQDYGDSLTPDLIECLGDEQAEVRRLAVGLLGEAGARAESALPALIERLSDTDTQVQISAVMALQRFREAARPAVSVLKRFLADGTEAYLRLSAAGAISRIAPEDPTSLPVIIEGLRDPSGMHRAAACEFLGERRSKKAVLSAMTLLSDREFVVRFAAAKAIGNTFNNWFHAVAICTSMLKDSQATNRSIGAQYLLSIGRHVKQDLDLLTMAISEVPWDVRIDIEEVLAALRRQP